MELKVWVEGIQRIVSGATEDTTCQDVVYALAHATGRTGKFTLTERWRNNERLLAPQERPVQVLMKWGEHSNDVQFILQRSSPAVESSQSLKVTSPSAKSTDLRKVNGNSNSAKAKQSLESTKNAEECVNLLNTSHSKISSSTISSDNSQSLGVHQQHPYTSNRTPPSYRDPPNPSLPHRTLPPYRDPPPPKLLQTVQNVQKESDFKVIPKRNLFRELQNEMPSNETMIYSPQYRDLVRLINYQRDKISAQQAELTKYDAEVIYWETKTKEQQTQLESLAKETAKVDAAMKHADEQIKFYGQIEQELDITRQQDRTVKSELTLVRSKLANCETELLLCKNKIRLLMDEIETEQRILCRENEERNYVERSMLAEVDRLQSQLEQTRRDAEMASRIGDTIRNEVTLLETTISEKKRQVEKLVADMKEANLQSLAMSPPDELKLILEGAFKPGSSRKMVGSPRQLENALPTTKNPHGVWV